MPFPETRDELVAAGYRFDNESRCRACGEEIEWWITPNGRKMPLDVMPGGRDKAITHFSTCSDAPLFRKA